MYGTRVSLSFAIVPMTNNSTTYTRRTNIEQAYTSWSPSVRSNALGCFYWGYMLSQIPGGYLAEKFGGKYVLLISMFICSASTILLPVGVYVGDWPLLFVTRIIIGLCQGVIYPACHAILSEWAPLDERGILATLSYTGTAVGVVLLMMASGEIVIFFGWPAIFYISGGSGVVWCLFWFIFGASSPESSNLVTIEEVEYVISSRGKPAEKKRPNTPWSKIFTSAPFYAIILADATNQFGVSCTFAQGPRYTANVHQISLRLNAIVSAIPHLVQFLLSFIFCATTRVLDQKKLMTTIWSRKLFTSLALGVLMVSMFILSFTTKDHTILAIFLLTLGYGFNTARFVGFLINHIDLSPNFAGTLMGISNFVSNIFSSGTQLIVGAIVKNESDPKQWQIVFLIISAMLLVGFLAFLILAKADVQPWNDPEEDNNKKDSIILSIR